MKLSRLTILTLCILALFGVSRRSRATETDGQPEPIGVAGGGCGSSDQPTNCKDICHGDGDGTCCFAKCVCDTDPDKSVREKYCKEYVDKGCNKVACR